MRRVHFIGSGYEVVCTVEVMADTPNEAIEKAEQLYRDNDWAFGYDELEVERW